MWYLKLFKYHFCRAIAMLPLPTLQAKFCYCILPKRWPFAESMQDVLMASNYFPK
jgi:hypothetical protein